MRKFCKKNKLAFLLSFLCFYEQSYAADRSSDDWERKSDLWQAVHLFETNDQKGAAAIIRDYRTGCPITYPYFEYLFNKGFMEQGPLSKSQIINYSYAHLKYIDPIFNSSLVIIEIGKKSKKLNKLLGDDSLLAYNKARSLEKNPTPKYGKPLNLYLKSSEPRSILAVCRLDPVKAKSTPFKGVLYSEIADYMRLMLQKHSKTADVLFECADHFHDKHELYLYFIDWSAGYGHAEAQVIKAEYSAPPELKAFFYAQAALNGHLRGFSGIAGRLERGEGVEKDVSKAFTYYQQAAKHPEAEGGDFHNLAVVYENGIGIQANLETAIEWYIQAIQKGHSASNLNLGRLLHRQGKYEEAFDYIKKAIEAKQFQGFEGIQQWLPESYTEIDLEQAVSVWAAEARQGNQMAQEYLAKLILWERVESKIISPEICCNWLEELVKGTDFPFKGKGELHSFLGGHYRNTTQQFSLAFFHFTESIKLGNKLAHLGLAQMYENGLGIPPDPKKAMYHYSESPECPSKWNNLGGLLMKADAIPALRSIYDQKARENFEKSIKFGFENNSLYILSCYNLGLLYLKKRTGGNETEQRAGVEKYLAEAANAGDKDAQRDLAIYYIENPVKYVSATIQSNDEEDLIRPLKPNHELTIEYVQKSADQNHLQYLLATTQSNYEENLVRPLKPDHKLALEFLQKSADQNDGEAMRMLAMLKLYSHQSFNIEIIEDCIKLLQKAYGASDLSEKSQINIKNVLCAFKVLASDGVIELKSDEITLVTEEEIQELKKRLEGVPEYAVLLNDSQTEEDESDSEDKPLSYSNIDNATETEEEKKEIIEIKETKEFVKEVKTDTPNKKTKKASMPTKETKKSIIRNTQITTSTNVSLSPDSKQEPLGNKERKLREGFEKKNMKWRKVMKLINLAIKVAGEGSIQPGKGSGTNIQVGESKINIHKPHGRNSTNTEAGRMKTLGQVMNSNKSTQ